jgi:hypothetical protein
MRIALDVKLWPIILDIDSFPCYASKFVALT